MSAVKTVMPDIPVLPKLSASESGVVAVVLVLDGQEVAVDTINRALVEKAVAQDVINTYRDLLDAVVEAWWSKLSQFSKTVQVRGISANATYTFTDSYEKMSLGVEPKLRMLLGNLNYDRLFEKRRAIVVEDEVALLDLVDSALLEAGGKSPSIDFMPSDVKRIFSVVTYIAPRENFRERHHVVREDLTAAQNEALDAVVRQIAARPTLSFK